jgi:hypothetical protein
MSKGSQGIRHSLHCPQTPGDSRPDLSPLTTIQHPENTIYLSISHQGLC